GEQRVKHLRGGAMQDVIFQGSRNRQPSGMAEVVMHMVRDEVVEHEPDIEDIDSTLEQIDDQVIDLDSVIPEEAAEKTPESIFTDSVPLESEALSTDGSVENPTTVADVSTASPRVAHKRHWRRRNLALEFAPGEAVSVTRRLY